jgi:uncharacterized protein
MIRIHHRATSCIVAAIMATGASGSSFAAEPPAREPVIAAIGAPTLTGWRAEIDRFASGLLKHPAWGYSHSQRDYALARALADWDRAAVDDDILFAAAYLHDIATFSPYTKQGIDHQDSGADQVGPTLEKAGFPMSKLAAVQSAIRTHMYYRELQDLTAIYLHDADGLDWLGAIGISRLTAMVSQDGTSPTGPEIVQ